MKTLIKKLVGLLTQKQSKEDRELSAIITELEKQWPDPDSYEEPYTEEELESEANAVLMDLNAEKMGFEDAIKAVHGDWLSREQHEAQWEAYMGYVPLAYKDGFSTGLRRMLTN